jgi:SAM-dependent methyltransferase
LRKFCKTAAQTWQLQALRTAFRHPETKRPGPEYAHPISPLSWTSHWSTCKADLDWLLINQRTVQKPAIQLPDHPGVHRMTIQTEQEVTFTETFERLEKLYDNHLNTYGDSPQATQQADRQTQEQRMRMLCQVKNLHQAKVLDFGCGTGHLLKFMRQECGYEGEYVGYDIALSMVETAATKYTDARFEHRNILATGVPEDFDIVFVTGTFNNFTGDNWAWMTACLRLLWQRTRIAMVFNNLSAYVDFFADGLYYEDPGRVLRFCKEELSPLVTLRHDYCIRPGVVPYEFTTYVYRTEITPRKLNTATVQSHD